MTAATDHDSYLAALPPDRRAALQHLREMVRSAAPDAVECISYGIPAFRIGSGRSSRVIAGYAAMKAHCGVYMFDGSLVARFAADLAPWSTDKGTIRFTPDHPLPDELVRRIVAARIAGTA